MSSVNGRERIDSFLALQPSRFKYLTKLSVEKYSSRRGGMLPTVEIILNEEPTPEGHRMKMRFVNSTELKIGNLNSTEASVLAIRDILEWGLEDVRYRVVEEEATTFSLNCEEFEFEIIS